MPGWAEDNRSAVQDYPFDFERYIEEQLRKIDDLEERKYAKEALLHGLGRILACTEEKYRKLERRIYEETEIAANRYETAMTIVQKKHYDPTNETLFPVDPLDLQEKALAEKLTTDRELFLGTIFLEADDGMQERFLKEGSFSAGSAQREVRVQIRPAERYQDMIEQLYHIFLDNHVPWQTVHTGYLDKFYDVYLDPVGIREENGAQDQRHEKTGRPALEELQIQYGAYERFVKTDVLPLWNVEWLSFDSADFMIPGMDGICYEHEFSLEDQEEQDGYLIASNEEILEIRHEKKKIVIRSPKETFEGWKALHIVRLPAARSLDYDAPFLTNRRRDSFLRRYAAGCGVPLLTKADLFRRITELDVRDYIEAEDYEIREHTEDFPAVRGMNRFVRDELFPMESRRILLIQFREVKPGHYLNGCMVRFVISQIQMEISEYRCVGVIG